MKAAPRLIVPSVPSVPSEYIKVPLRFHVLARFTAPFFLHGLLPLQFQPGTVGTLGTPRPAYVSASRACPESGASPGQKASAVVRCRPAVTTRTPLQPLANSARARPELPAGGSPGEDPLPGLAVASRWSPLPSIRALHASPSPPHSARATLARGGQAPSGNPCRSHAEAAKRSPCGSNYGGNCWSWILGIKPQCGLWRMIR
jgi:hypothetical protein